jgi:hypothetical protein
MKLSTPQIELLKELNERPHYVAPFYGPFKKLMAAGMIEEREGKYSAVTHITPAGVEALSGQSRLKDKS